MAGIVCAVATCARRLFDASHPSRRSRRRERHARDRAASRRSCAPSSAKLLGYATVRRVRARRSDGEDARQRRSSCSPTSRARRDEGARRGRARFRRSSIARSGGFTLEPWDWQYYAEQVRKAEYDLDEAQIKPYFELDRVLRDGVFFAATQLYGITFDERKDIPVYQPDVRVFEVFDADGSSLALFYADYFKRDNKTGGAWMDASSTNRGCSARSLSSSTPRNFTKPAPGQPALLSFDDVTTLFHEFGHALHGMFSRVEYPMLSGTNVPRDFVEFPSQFNEHWALEPAVFANYARHYETGEPMPQEFVDKIKKSRTFNQGYRAHGIHRGGAARHGVAHHHRRTTRPPTSTRSSGRRCARSASQLREVPPRYARRTSRTSGMAATRRAISPICGPKCSTTTRSRGSRSVAG